MTTRRAMVGNAGDEEQVARAARREKLTRAQELEDLRTVLATAPGRRLLWRLMGYCQVFASVYDDVPARMAHGTGKQDVGHFLMHEIEEARPDAFLTMMQEHANQEFANEDESAALPA